jgi:glutathione S-transferase
VTVHSPSRGNARQAAGTEKRNLPVLWHLKASHYNEKARWALDYKQLPHIRRAAVPGRHRLIAQKLAGGRTFPVLIMDGEAIGDSTAIIEALERRYPEPPLYPSDPLDRDRALELEELFDEEVGPHSRLLFLHHALPDARLMLGAFVPDLAGLSSAVARATFPLLRRRAARDFGIDAHSVRQAYEKLAAAGARFRAELQPSGYLVGEGFTVADLTLASLVAPIVCPPQFPYPQPQRRHRALAPLREVLAQEGLLYWATDIYARHRGTSAEVRGASS